MKLFFLSSALVCLMLAGCKKDPAGPSGSGDVPANVKGVYVLNEGDFSDPVGARLTLYDVVKDSVYRDVYEAANGNTPLGNLGDDMKIHNGKGYIVMSGSQNLIVINLSTHVKEGEAVFPGSAVHDILIDSVNSRIYVTRLFSRSVYVLNLLTLTVVDSIAVGANPQGMVISRGRLFVCNSGYGSDSTVSVIDLSVNRVIASVTTPHGPTNAAVAPDGKVWVACTGNAFGTPATAGAVVVIDPVANSVTSTIPFGENLWGVISIGADGFAYIIGSTPSSFFGGPVHRISLSSRTVISGFIPGTYYGLGYDDVAREIYVSDVKNFSGNGDVKIYTNAGALRKTFSAQKGPAVFAFRR